MDFNSANISSSSYYDDKIKIGFDISISYVMKSVATIHFIVGI